MGQGYSNYTLTDAEQVINDLEEAYLDNLVLAQAIGMTPVDPGTLVLTRNRVTNMSDAIKIAEGSTFPRDAITRAPEHTYIDKIGIMVELTMEEVNVGRMAGIPIDDMNLRSQARQIAEFTEANCVTVLNAVATAGGVTWTAAADSVSGKKWNEAGTTIYNDVVDIIDLFETNNSGSPDMMFFGGGGIGALLRRKNNDLNGTRILDDLQGLGLDIMKVPGLGTGNVLFANSQNVTLKAAIPFALDGPYWVHTNQIWEWTAYTRIVPDVVSYRDLYLAAVLS
jgi:hypothetical protein